MNILLAMIPAFFWGTTYSVTQYTLHDWPPLLLGALRALPAGLILLAIKPSLPNRQYLPTLAKLGLVNIAIFFSLIFVMALTLPSAISGVGMISVPVFAMLYLWVVKKIKPNVIQTVCGFGIVSLAWLLFDPSSISLDPIGLIAMLLAIMCIVVGSSITKSLGTKIHWWTVLTWQLILGGTFLSIAALIHSHFAPEPYREALSSFDTRNFIGLLWVIGFNTALGYGMYVWLLQRMSVVDFTFGGIANPIAGILGGMLLVGNAFSVAQYALMLGMILLSLAPQSIIIIRKRCIASSRNLKNEPSNT